MGIPWAYLSRHVKTKILTFLVSSSAEKMNEKQLSLFLSACLLVNFKWQYQENIQIMIFQTIQRLYGEKDSIKYDVAPSFVKTIVCLGKRQLQWDLLLKEVQDSLRNAIELFAPVFTEQEITDLSDG
jgi:hypothetical protein